MSESQILQRIDADLKEALRSRDAVKLSCLRMLKSSLKNQAIDNPSKPLNDELVLQVIQKQVKQHLDSKEAFEKGSRPELAEKETQEAQILSAYMPEQLSEEELKKIVQDIIEKNQMQSKKDFGKAMKLCQEAVQGKADNRSISACLNQVLV